MNAFSSPKHLESKSVDTPYVDTTMMGASATVGLPIGEIMSQANTLSQEQIEQVLHYQKENGNRFGEAAIALGFANQDDVTWALSQQFHYPYLPDGDHDIHSDLVVIRKPLSDQAEAIRTLRSHLIMKMYSDNAKQRPALAVLSPDSGDGKSYLAANLAAAFSQLSGRTLIVDADMRNPRQHELFGLKDPSIGLSSILTGRPTSRAIHPVEQLPNLYVLPVGVTPPNPLELVERPAFGLLMRALLTKFDRVIVDTPAASRGADGAVIASKCGAAAVVARRDHSRLTALQNIVNTIGMTRTRIIGSVINEF